MTWAAGDTAQGTGDPLFPVTREDWPVVKLRRFMTIQSGDSPPESKDDPSPEASVPIYGANGVIGYCSQSNIDGQSIVIGRVGTSGAVHTAPRGCWVTDNALIVTLTGDRLSPRFTAYLLRAMDLGRYATQTAQPLITQYDVLSRRFGLPSRVIQRTIADFLDEKTAGIDRIVKDKKRLIWRLEEARHSLIHARATRGLAPGTSTKESEVPWIGRVPEHWDTKKLRYMAECLDRKRIPLNSSERADMQGPYPYWGANGIVDHVDDWLFDEELVLLGEDGAPFFDPHKPVARFVTGKIWVNNHAHILRAHRDTDPRFLAYALNAVDYADYIKGSTRDKLVQAEMNEIRLPAPPILEQKKIADVLDDEGGEIDGLIEDLKEQLSSLEEYRTSLVSAAVTGQIDVRASASPVV